MPIPWDQLASGITAPAITGIPRPPPSFDLPADRPVPAEPFLCVDVTWADGTTSYYGEIDRPTGAVQIVAKVLDLGPIRRAFAPDHAIQRTATTLVLENVTGVVGQKIRQTGWTGIRIRFWVGFPELARADWQPIAGAFRIDTAPEITPTEVTLNLIDDVTSILDQVVRLPNLAKLRDVTIGAQAVNAIHDGPSWTGSPSGEPYFDWGWGRFNQMEEDDVGGVGVNPDAFAGDPPVYFPHGQGPKIPIPYGPTWAKVPWAWVIDTSYDETEFRPNPSVAMVLGASRDPGWMTPHFWAGRAYGTGSGVRVDDVRIHVEREGLVLPWLTTQARPTDNPSGGSTQWADAYPDNGIAIYINVYPVDADTEGDPLPASRDTWYVAVLYVAVTRALDKATRKDFKAWLKVLNEAAHDNAIWVQFPYGGAEGPGRHDAARIVEHLCTYHAQGDVSRLDAASFADAGTSDALRGSRCAGTIAEEVQALEVVNAIARSHGVDFFYARDGKLACHAPGISALDLVTRIPGAERFTDYRDVIKGTFKVWQPTGDERNGYGTVFHIEGMPEPRDAQDDELEKTAWDYAVQADGWRRIDRTLDASWLVPGPVQLETKDIVDAWSRPYRQPRWMAGFGLSLRGLRLDLRDFLALSHWAGPTESGARGWTDRLLRVEAVTLDWKRRLLEYECLDAEYVRSQRPYILDDEDLWLRHAGGYPEYLQLVAGNPRITLGGFTASNYGVVVGDVVWIQGHYVGRVIKVSELWVDVTPAPQESAVHWAFRLEAGHTTTGRSTKYGALADEQVTDRDGGAGAYSNGDPGHQLQEG